MIPDDRIRIHELINFHGHVMDEGEFDRLPELFTENVTYDLSAYGAGVLAGVNAIAQAGRALGDANPLAHHVTNVVVLDSSDDVAHVRSKGLAVMADGTTGSVVYDDEVVRTSAGWRIAQRHISPRRQPLHPSR